MTEKEKPSPDNGEGKNNNSFSKKARGNEPWEKETAKEEQEEQNRRVDILSTWMEGTGPEADVVISSRIRLARNLKGVTFTSLASEEQRSKVLQVVRQAFGGCEELARFQLLEMEPLSSLYRQVMVEKHLVSPLLARDNRCGALFLSDDEVLSAMVNEEDHLRIQCLLPGLQLEKAWELASQLDDRLEGRVGYAFDEELGFLTSCPTNVGTGMRVSAMVHIPALAITRQLGQILSAVNQVGLAVRGLYGEGTEMIGSLFQISNQITLGQSEEEILENLYGVTSQLIAQERQTRERLVSKSREKLADRAGRAYGILRHCRLIGSQEAMQLLSDVRLGVDLGLLNEVPAKILSELMVLSRPGCLQYLKGRHLNAHERDLERARQIQKHLSLSTGRK